MSEIIYFNGKKYHGIREMPSDVRQAYERMQKWLEDADGDGVPDIAQIKSVTDLKDVFNAAREIGQIMNADASISPFQRQLRLTAIKKTDQGIYVNGRFFESPEDMPQNVFEIYDAAVSQAEGSSPANDDDAWPSDEMRQSSFEPHDDDETFNQQFQPFITETDTPVETINSTTRFLVVLGIVALLGFFTYIAWILFL